MRLARIAVLTFALLASSASAALAFPGFVPPDRRLEMAREEHGGAEPPPGRHDLPAGALTVTPSQLVAARAGQRVRFSVTLDRRVPGATLHVRLPRRWLEVGASGLRAVRAPVQVGTARGRARLRRRDTDVALNFADAAAGSTASFDVQDVGIPAGTYDLRFTWVDDANGHVQRAGTARVMFLAPTREALPSGLTAPGIARNVSNDSLEESETFIAAVPGNKDRIVATVNWPGTSGASTLPAWITNDGGVTWTGPLSMPETLDVPGSSSPESASICCDPTLAADALGNVWVGGLSTNVNGPAPARAVVNRIAAGTQSFQTQSTGLPTGGVSDADKPMMTIDNSPNSATFGRLYMVWDQLPTNGSVNVVVSQCDTRPSGTPNAAWCDNADHWSAPATVASTGSYIYADVAVGPDGRVYVTWWDYSAPANAIRGDVCSPISQNCASSTAWSAAPGAQNVAQLDATGGVPVPFACPILAQPGGRDAPAPNVDVDRSGGPNHDRVYVTWNDLRPNSGTTRCVDAKAPTGTPQSTHMTWDAFVASAPGGALPGGSSASTSVGTRLLTDGEGGGQSNSDDWFAWLTVDQTTGQPWADFYSTRDDATRHTTNFYARSVTPNGSSHTLGPLTKVSSGASNYSGAPCCNFGNDYGDYTGMDATSGAAYPVWSDNSSGGGDGEASAFVRQLASGGLATPVTGAASGVLQTSATLNGTVNPHGQSTTYGFDWGTTTAYGQQTSDQSAGSGTSAQSASSSLPGLTAATTYHYRLRATNASGTTVSEDRTLTTAAAQAPTVTTTAAGSVTGSTATLNGTVNPNGDTTTYHFEYGTGTAYGTSTASQSAGAGTSSVSASAPVTGLAPATTYHYRLVATNGTNTTQGNDQTFTTLSPPATTTSATTSITSSGATFNGTVNPKGQATTYYFHFGKTTTYGAQTTTQNLAAGSSNVQVSTTVTGLDPDSDYHVELVAQNATGTTFGGDDAFHTLALPPPASPTVTTGASTGVTDTAATVGGSVNPNGTAASYHFEYGTTTSYGSSTTSQSAGSGTSNVDVSASLGSLSPATTYHYRLVATNGGGTSNGSDATFHTAPTTPPGQPPAVTTGQASAIGQTAATLNATVDPKGQATAYHFVYGTTTSYGQSTGDASAGSGTGGVAVTTQLSGLSTGTLYHAKAVATNGSGTTDGGDVTFTTDSPPPKDNGGGGGTVTPGTTGTATTTPPPSGSTATPPAAVLPVAPTFTVALAPQRPADVARRGLALMARCRTACRLDASVYLTGGDARRLGLVRRARNLLVGSVAVSRLASGARRLVVRLRLDARRAVAGSAAVVLLVRIRARDASGRASRVRAFRVTLRRTGRSPSVQPLAVVPAWASGSPLAGLDWLG